MKSKNEIKFYALILIIVCLSGLRFTNLQADFPSGLTGSTALYTDEGLWARNAVAALRSGAWYVQDGYNPILSVPVIPLLQMFLFRLFGVSLVAARSLVAASSIILLGLVYALLRRFLQRELAIWGPLIIAGSYSFFAYSRIALLEIPMLCFAVLSLLIALRTEASYVSVVASAVALYLGILTKTTALFVLPVIYLAVLMQRGSRTKKLFKMLALTLTLLILFATYYALVVQPFTSDYQTFSDTNISSQVATSSWRFITELKAIARVSLKLYPLLLPSYLGAAFLLLCLRSYRLNPLFLAASLWAASAFLALFSTHYHPSRYFVILIVPMALTIPLAMEAAIDPRRIRQIKRGALTFAVIIMLTANLARITLHMAQPQFTFVRMAESVGVYMRRYGDQNSASLIGEFADTISLVSELDPVDIKRGSLALEARIKQFNPQLFVSLGEMGDQEFEALSDDYRIEKIQTYNVFNNYAQGRPVFLYRLEKRQNPAA
ncbi:MAG: glycosyltransferase family 39 protein [Cyanobacteria bacterium P01_A01_bin.17]